MKIRGTSHVARKSRSGYTVGKPTAITLRAPGHNFSAILDPNENPAIV